MIFYVCIAFALFAVIVISVASALIAETVRWIMRLLPPPRD